LSSDAVDITKHDLVPKHRIVSPDERDEIRKRYRVASDLQFPKILKKDPIIKAIGAEKGDLVEIKKKNPIIGETVYYRVVVD
jgi:DNA-directed RNA polymerase subunit H